MWKWWSPWQIPAETELEISTSREHGHVDWISPVLTLQGVYWTSASMQSKDPLQYAGRGQAYLLSKDPGHLLIGRTWNIFY